MLNEYQIYEELDKVEILLPYKAHGSEEKVLHKCWISLSQLEKLMEFVGEHNKKLYYVPTGTGYVYLQWSEGEKGSKVQKSMYLHRFLTDCPKGKVVDHRDHNGLNCTIENMRVCTQKENLQHRRKFKTKADSSKYKGVYKYGQDQYMAKIAMDGKQQILGYFPNERQAATAYDVVAQKEYGEFAVLNFPMVRIKK